MTILSYKDLIVWQKAMNLVEEVYKLTDQFPQSELYELSSQMRRSVASIPSNIAEGRKLGSKKESRKFLRIAFGSGAELETQVEIAKRLAFGKTLNYKTVDALLDEVMRMLNTMIHNMGNPTS